jgi:hypothetical protein
MLNFNYSTATDGKGGALLYPPFVTQQALDELAARFVVRDDDVFIVTYPKAGTNWMRQILHLLSHQGEQGGKTSRETVPFLEKEACLGNWAALAYQGERRYFMSHLPYALMPGIRDSKASYIYVARNPKDCAVSLFHFMTSRADLRLQNEWDDFFEAYRQGQVPYGDWFDHNLTWWDASHTAGNILFVKYEEMQKDLAASVEEVAAFIDFPLTPDLRDRVVAQSTFAAMASNTKANWNLNLTQNGASDKHLRKGVVGDWKNRFSKVQSDRYDALYRQTMMGSSLAFDFEPTTAK